MKVLAEVHIRLPEEGGRTQPIKSGYTAVTKVDSCAWSCHLEFTEVQTAAPGDIVEAKVSFVRPEPASKLEIGDSFEIFEGSHVVAEATVKDKFPG